MARADTQPETMNGRPLSSPLLAWFRANQRPMPWRSDPSPYRVWISEVMLQQTQVVTVIPYFERWVARFPDVEALAGADEDEVLALWSGLGYYRRARLAHRAAQQLMARYGGEVPRTVTELLTLPGIGRYTAGAIASIAFGETAPAVDGNVIRVLTRLEAIDEPARSAVVQRRLWSLATELIPDGEASSFNQALMELGSLVCTPRKPSCQGCPLAPWCEAHRLGLETQLPVLTRAGPKRSVGLASALIHRGDHDHFWLVRHPDGGRFAGLWDFPTVEVSPGPEHNVETYRRALQAQFLTLGWEADIDAEVVPHYRQLLSHLTMTVQPFVVRVAPGVKARQWGDHGAWYRIEDLDAVALSSATRRLATWLGQQPKGPK